MLESLILKASYADLNLLQTQWENARDWQSPTLDSFGQEVDGAAPPPGHLLTPRFRQRTTRRSYLSSFEIHL